MMRKLALILLTVFVAATGLGAQSLTEDRDIETLKMPSDGRAKIGILLGYPSGATFGYRFSNWFEANTTLGYNFRDAALISVNGLFTIVNIPVGDQGLMPLSLGPQINFILGGSKKFQLDVTGDIRLEYTFEDIPLNLFGDFSFGFRFFHDGDWVALSGGIGVRYVF
ncbi:MAG: hypothetical protein MI717_12685 [Spirochaetales bacterium]|nr:hypothetical protein [Spirochaetales bacterium]